jgi:GH25 family lysozyme M1 (1,4-beta-N-acetylmuramidase)
MRAVGIDISKWDVSFDYDRATIKPDFVINRVSYGTLKDSLFDSLIDNIMKAPIKGGYIYLRSGESWLNQAASFYNIVKDYPYDFFVCDVERIYNVVDRTYIAMAIEWMNKIKVTTNKPVFIYSNPDVYNTAINVWEPIRAKMYPFWVAQYPLTIPNPQLTNPKMPGSRSDWKIWQFSAGEHNTFGRQFGVGRNGVDINVYNGTLEEMKIFLGVNTIPIPILTDKEKLDKLWELHPELH